MSFKKIKNFQSQAKKSQGDTLLTYELYVDDQTWDIYVKIDNESSGSVNTNLFLVKEYYDLRDSKKSLNSVNVYDIDTGIQKLVDDNNNGSFLKSVLKELFD